MGHVTNCKNTKWQKMYEILYRELDEKYEYFYTNPPKGVPILTKEELFEFGSLNPVTYYNPVVTALNANEDRLLNEAEYATYPIRTTIKYVSDALNIPLSSFKTVAAYNFTYFIKVTIPNIEEDRKKIDKAMHLCGYYCAKKEYHKGDTRFLDLTYEPKYIDEADYIARSNQVLYHLSPLPYKEKILRNGFIPKSNSTKFTYPDRSYFFLGNVDKAKIKEWIPVFRFHNKKYKNTPYCLYTINVDKIPNNVIFYLDPNLKGGCYTSDNISPNTIISVEEIND